MPVRHGTVLNMQFPELSGFGRTGQHSGWVSNAMRMSQVRRLVTENGGEECTPDYFAVAGLRSVDYTALAALCMFFRLKWTEPCLLLRDALLLFRNVAGELFAVDSRQGDAVAKRCERRLGRRAFCVLMLALLHASHSDLQGDGVCFPHLYSNIPLDGPSWKCFVLPRCLKVLFIIRTCVCFFNTVKMYAFTFIMLSGNNAFQSFLLIRIASFNLARTPRTGKSLRTPR